MSPSWVREGKGACLAGLNHPASDYIKAAPLLIVAALSAGPQPPPYQRALLPQRHEWTTPYPSLHSTPPLYLALRQPSPCTVPPAVQVGIYFSPPSPVPTTRFSMVTIPVAVRDISSLDPGELVLIALAAILACIGFTVGLIATVSWVRRRRASDGSDNVLSPEAAAAQAPTSSRRHWGLAWCFGRTWRRSTAAPRPTPPPPGTPLRAVRDALVAGTVRASRDHDRFSCALCRTRLSMDGGADGRGMPDEGATRTPAADGGGRPDGGGPPVDLSALHGVVVPPPAEAAAATAELDAAVPPGPAPWLCTLWCGHTFHARCVARRAAAAGPGASCPVCKLDVVEGREGVVEEF